MIRITEYWAPHVSIEAIQSTSRPATDEAFPDTHLTACDLHCSGATAAWHPMLIMLHGVTGDPATSHGLEIWCPVYRHAAQRGWGYTLQHRVVKTTAGHAQRSFWQCVQSTWHLMVCVYGCADPEVLIIRIWLIFGPSIRPNTNSTFFYYSVPNRIRIEFSVQP